MYVSEFVNNPCTLSQLIKKKTDHKLVHCGHIIYTLWSLPRFALLLWTKYNFPPLFPLHFYYYYPHIDHCHGFHYYFYYYQQNIISPHFFPSIFIITIHTIIHCNNDNIILYLWYIYHINDIIPVIISTSKYNFFSFFSFHHYISKPISYNHYNHK